MQPIKFTLIAAIVGVASTAAYAQDPGSDQARRDRMDAAYNDYHNSTPRGESTMRRDFHRAGSAIKRDTKKVGHAIGKGIHKTGEAIEHGGKKLEGDTAPKQ